MEQVENLTVNDDAWQCFKTQAERDAEYEAYLEEQDRNYEDKVFDEMEENKKC